MYQRLGSWMIVASLAILIAAAGLVRTDAAQFNYPVVRPVALGQPSFNGDSTTDERDLLLLLGNWRKAATGAVEDYDLDGSGAVGTGDLWLFALSWHKTAPREGVPSYVVGKAFSAVDGEPLAGFEVLLLGEDSLAESHTDGEYTYEVLIPEEQGLTQVIIEVRAENMTYAHRKVSMFPGETMTVDPVYLVPVDTNVTEIGPGGGTYVSSDGTVEILIPPGALNTTVGVTSARYPFGDSLPAPLPKTSHFTYCLDRYPDGIRFATDATTRIANDLGFEPGTPVPVGIYDRDQARWIPEGMAFVSADGVWVEYQSDHFSPCDANVTQRPEEDSGPPEDRRRRRPPERRRERGEEGGDDDDCEEGDSRSSFIAARTGHLNEFVELPSYRSGGQEHRLWLEYASDAAYPNTVIGVNTLIKPDEYVAPPWSYQFQVSFLGQSKDVQCATREGFNRFAYYATGRDAQGNWVDSGVYRAQFILGHNYRPTYGLADYFGGPPTADTGVPVRDTDLDRRHAQYQLSEPLLNLREGSLGAGWALGGLRRLYPNGQGAIMLAEGTKTKVFNGFGTIDTVAGEGYGSQYWEVEDGIPAVEFPLDDPARIAFDATGDLYVSTQYHIIRFDENWIGYVFAGGGEWGNLGDGGPAKGASIEPKGMVFDPEGNLIVADYGNHRIRKIDTQGIITTIAGNGESGSAGDGRPATEAQLAKPYDVALDREGNLYIANSDLAVKAYWRISKVAPDGIITTYVGGGMISGDEADGKDRLEVRVPRPMGLLVDHDGNLLYTELSDGSDAYVSRVDKETGIVRRIAGKEYVATEYKPYPISGPATDVVMQYPRDLDIDANGNVFILDYDYDGVWMLEAAQRLSFIVGRGNRSLFDDPNPPLGDGGYASAAQFWSPEGVALGPDGNLYVADTDNGLIRVVNYGMPRGATKEFTAPIGDRSRLVQHPDETYSLFLHGDITVRFNAEGLQTHLIDLDQNTTTYEYDEQGNLILIRDPYGLETRLACSGGRLSQVENPAGRVTRLEYDVDGNLASVTLPDGGQQQFAYDERHLLVQKTDARGRTTQYHFNDYARVESVETSHPLASKVRGAAGESIVYGYEASQLAGLVNPLRDDSPFSTELSPVSQPGFDRVYSPDGGTVKMITDLSGRVRFVTGTLGHVTEYEWEQSCDLPKRLVLPGGGEYQWEYDALVGPRDKYLLNYYIDPFGTHTTFLYDDEARLKQISSPRPDGLFVHTYLERDATGHVVYESFHAYPRNPITRWEYDSKGRVTKLTSPSTYPEVRERFFSYDSLGQLKSVIDEEGGLTSYAYDTAGNVTAVTTTYGGSTRYEYDAMNRRTRSIDPMGRVTAFGYDAGGEISAVTAPGRGSLALARDGFGRIAGVSYGAASQGKVGGGTSESAYLGPEFGYDAAGNILAVTNALGHVTTFGYDAGGNLIAATDAEGNTCHYAYDADRNLAAATDAMGYAVEFDYDIGRRLTAVAYPDDTSREFIYNAINTPEWMIDRSVRESTYVYYYSGEPWQRILPDAETDNLEFHTAGWLTSYDNGLVHHTFEYNGLGWLRRWNLLTLGKYFQYDYACCNRPSSILDADGGETRFDYDAAGRLTAVDTIQGGTTTFEYEESDLPWRELAPNGVETLYDYNELGVVRSIIVRRVGGAVLAQWDYTRDAVFVPSEISTPEGVHYYNYDANGRLIRAEHPGGSVESFSYDAVGNRTSSSDVAEYRYDSLHRLQGYGNVSLTYDPEGNLSTRTDTSGTTLYTHDADNRLRQVELPGGDVVRYGYDSGRFRFFKEVNGATTYYFYAPLLMAEYDGGGALQCSYTRHPVTGEILQFHDQATGQTYYVHRDALGTPQLLTNSSGNVAWRARYRAFGGASVDPSSTVTFNPRFLGQYYDEETGLHYNLKRYYEPEVGRYIEPDPLLMLADANWYLGVGRHEYVYARNNPIVMRDVFGLCDECDDCPSGRWNGVSMGADFMVFLAGGSASTVSMICSEGSARARFTIRCLRIGGGLGVGVAPGGIRGRGCNAGELRESLAGWGSFGSISLGVIGAGGSHSLSSFGVWSVSVGLSFGAELAAGQEYCWVD